MTPHEAIVKKYPQGFYPALIITCLVAGTLDALAAIFILAGGKAAIVFEYIASAVYGPQAFAGGAIIIMAGILFHYTIASCFTIFYFFIYCHIPLFRKGVVWSIIIYGLFVWAVMAVFTRLLPNLHITSFNPGNNLKDALILMVTIGLPNTLMRRRLDIKDRPVLTNN